MVTEIGPMVGCKCDTVSLDITIDSLQGGTFVPLNQPFEDLKSIGCYESSNGDIAAVKLPGCPIEVRKNSAWTHRARECLAEENIIVHIHWS